MSGHVSPERRRGCASCVVSSDDCISDNIVLIFGGEDDSRCYKDCWMFEPASETLTCLASAPQAFTPRSYHSATYIDGVVWIIGGMNKFMRDPMQRIVADCIWCFNVSTRVFSQVSCASQQLTLRTAHGACVNPVCPTKILIFGGYTYQKGAHVLCDGRKRAKRQATSQGEWRNDLVELDTAGKVCSAKETKVSPCPRAYMTFDVIGDVCVALFGRSRNVLVKESIAMYDPLQGEWITSVRQEGVIPPSRHSHRVSQFGENALILYGGSLEKEQGKSEEGKETCSILIYHRDRREFMWHCMSSAQEHCGRFSHVQAIVSNTLHIIGGYSREGESRQYPSNSGKIVFDISREDMNEDILNQHARPCAISNISFSSVQIKMSLSEPLHSLERTYQVEDTLVPETNETFVSQTPDQHTLTTSAPDALFPNESTKNGINIHDELKISDKKWKDASKECAFWKLLAEEERGKYEHASSMLLEKEEEYANMERIVRELRIHIKLVESELRASKNELNDMATNLEITKASARKDREQTYQELKAKLDERAHQCNQMGEAYKKLQNDMEDTVISLKTENKLLRIDLETSKRQQDCLLASYNESMAKIEHYEEQLAIENEKKRKKESLLKEMTQQIEEYANSTHKMQSLMNDITLLM